MLVHLFCWRVNDANRGISMMKMLTFARVKIEQNKSSTKIF